MNEQKRVAEAVKARGYFRNSQGWNWRDAELLCRNLCKLIEELDEAIDHAWLPWSLRLVMKVAGWLARWCFDRDVWLWRKAEVTDWDKVRDELYDCQVVLFTAGYASAVDVVQGALDKALADVERGTR